MLNFLPLLSKQKFISGGWEALVNVHKQLWSFVFYGQCPNQFWTFLFYGQCPQPILNFFILCSMFQPILNFFILCSMSPTNFELFYFMVNAPANFELFDSMANVPTNFELFDSMVNVPTNFKLFYYFLIFSDSKLFGKWWSNSYKKFVTLDMKSCFSCQELYLPRNIVKAKILTTIV